MSLDLVRNMFLIFAVCFVFGCQDDDSSIIDASPRNSAGVCDLELEDFILNSENTILSAYREYSNVTFINEAGDLLSFSIGVPVASRFEGIFPSNDTLDICYAFESIETKMVSPEGIEFTILSEPKAYYLDLALEQFADVTKVFYDNKLDEASERRLVFRKVLDIKNYPPPLYATTRTIESQFFVDAEFNNVEETQFNTPIIKLFYNDVIGIVAFIDELGVLWQFDSKS